MVLFALGHSTRPLEELLALLQGAGVRVLADIRTTPKSRHVPHANAEALGPALGAAGIRYIHFRELGGLRKPAKDSRNTGWKNKGFRGYADYMQTDAFERALGALLEAAREGTLAFMCAEAVPWRCHRSLLADALVARGHEVRHLLGVGKEQAHRLTPFASVQEGRVSYPGEEPELELEP